MLYKKSSLLLAVLLPLGMTGTKIPGKKTGIEGYIFRISGNHMPSPNVKPTPPKGIRTNLYIYELTGLSAVTRVGESAFYSSIHTHLIETVHSDSTGYFFEALPPGEYSLFTKKDALFYANNFDGDNHIAPVKVVAGEVTQVNVNVDYDAVY
jgi:hypothetical protein